MSADPSAPDLSENPSSNSPRPSSHLRRAATVALGLALVASLGSAVTPAQGAGLAPAATSGVVDDCIRPAQRATEWRQGDDTDEVSRATRARVAEVVRSATTSSSARTVALPAQVHVPVFIHVIRGTHKGEKRIDRRKARKMFYVLKNGYAGAQSPEMGSTGVVFDLRRITVHRNDKWFHAAPLSRADRQMKRKLHRGRAQALNIYVNRPKSGRQLLLGFSLFPWQRAGHRRLDGVTVSEISLPGGRANGYNLGDTVIHETGHWFGLLHTFEGGCGVGTAGDGVEDTAAEASPSFRCQERNTCLVLETNPADPGGLKIDRPDPIHNFMDYSYDACMDHFTPGQRDRMIALFMHYRFGRR